MNKPRFASAIGHAQSAGAQAGNRNDIHHRSTLFQHQRRASLGADKRAGKVHRHDAGPDFEIRILDGLKIRNARIIHQRIYPPETLLDGLNACCNLIRLRHIGFNRHGIVRQTQRFMRRI